MISWWVAGLGFCLNLKGKKKIFQSFGKCGEWDQNPFILKKSTISTTADNKNNYIQASWRPRPWWTLKLSRGRHRLRFCAGKSLSLYYCSFNMKLCSCGDLVLLTWVSLQRTKPPALWMIYIHGKWQPEQESEDVILSQTGNKASRTSIPFTESAVISPA